MQTFYLHQHLKERFNFSKTLVGQEKRDGKLLFISKMLYVWLAIREALLDNKKDIRVHIALQNAPSLWMYVSLLQS